MFGYIFNIDIQETYSHHSDEQYGEWEEHYTNTFKSIKPTDQFPDVLSFEEIKTGEECYVVWAEWSTGDSYGRGHNRCNEPLMVFKSLSQAEELRTELLKDEEGYSQEITLKSGLQLSINKGWVGYFEYLNDIHIDRALMG